MVLFGFGELIGSYLQGYIIDRWNTKKATLSIILFVSMMIMVTITAIKWNSYGFITFFMTFLWGLQDSSMNVHLFQILGFEFDTAAEPFSVYLMMQGLSIFGF